MFGYVRPLKGSLRVAEYERFRAIYCGLCRAIGKRYGFAASMMLNYDLAFFAAALEGLYTAQPGAPVTCYPARRCVAHPLHRRCIACAQGGEPTRALEIAADLNVILACFKFRDDAQDGRFARRAASRLALIFFSRAENKAKRLHPELYARTGEQLAELAELEREGCTSLDMCADCFAQILRAAGRSACEEDGLDSDLGAGAGETFGELLYHVGRWIYIIDAYDDLVRDLGRGEYNAVAARYGLREGDLGAERIEEVRRELERTLSLSLDAAYMAYERLEFGQQSGFVSNVLMSGLDMVSRSVFEGIWRRRKQKKEN